MRSSLSATGAGDLVRRRRRVQDVVQWGPAYAALPKVYARRVRHGAGGARGLWAPLVMLRTFPNKLVYTVHDDALLLVAVFHARRRPGYWLEKLRQLGR